MSVIAHAAKDASTVTAPDHTPRPGIGVAINVEIIKLILQPTLRIVLTVCVLAPAGFAILMRVGSNRPADTLFGRWAATSGFATSLTVLNWAIAYGTPLLAGLFAGDIFASEDRHGTWKTILTRSCTRSRLFLGKAVAATVCVWFSFLVIGVASLLAGLAAVGSSPLVGLSGQLVGSGQALGLVAASWMLSLLWTSIFVALGLLLSAASRSGIVGVLGPLVVAVVLQLLETITSGQVLRAILPTTPSDAWHVLLTAPVPPWPIIQAVITDIGYTTVFAGSAWYLLRRRDFAGADTTRAGRHRASVRISIAITAICALLGALSTVGPTALTANRLDTSIATTFGHLAEVRYQWQTGAQADPTIPWHAVCNRGGTPIGTTVADSTGAGDDWSCTISDLRAADGVGTNALDVNLKSNGCYAVQSPPGAVGPLYVTDDRGHIFLNPLFAFNGCLGTP